MHISSNKTKIRNTRGSSSIKSIKNASSSASMYKNDNKLINRDKNNILVLKSLFECKTYLEVKEKLIQFHNNSKITDARIQIMKNAITPLNKGGKSGSIVGYFKPTEVTKLFIRSINEYEITSINECLKLSNIFNEMLVNFLLTNVSKIIPAITNPEKQLLERHTLPLLNYGISSSGSFITIPMVGINGITNLRELLEDNHSKLFKSQSPSLTKEIKDINDALLETYDQIMANKIAGYCNTLRVLQKYLKYVNSDVKMTNIFIRGKPVNTARVSKLTRKTSTSTTRKSRKYKNASLEGMGIITDFELIISDLEKSAMTINDLHITTEARSPMKITLSGLIGQRLIYDIRYGCSDIIPKCNSISILDVDIIMFIIDYYAFMLRMDSNFITRMPKIYNTFKELLGDELMAKIKDILEEGKYVIDTNFSFKIGKVLKKICQHYNINKETIKQINNQ